MSDTARRIRRLAARDGWRCHLCGNPIDPGATRRKRATLDHVIPRSQGGGNGIENMRLAHSVCNNHRGDLPLDEYFVALRSEET